MEGKAKIGFISVLCMVAIVAAISSFAIRAVSKGSGWSPKKGETIVYDMKLMRITLANQTLKVEEKKKIAGVDCWNISSTTKSVKLAKKIMEIDDKTETCIDLKNLTPVYYTAKVRETGWKSDTKMSFKKGKIVIDEIRGENLEEKRHTEVPATAGVLDDVSIIFNLRGKTPKVGDSFNVKVIAENEVKNAKVTVLKKEKIETKIGEREALVVKCTFKDAMFWIEDSPDRIPLRFEVETKAGRVKGFIKEYKAGN